MTSNAYCVWIKRPLDLVCASVLLLLVSPLLAALGIAVLIRLGRPVIFKQTRAGRHGRAFVALKFRTMTLGLDEHGKLLPEDERLTGLGEFMRRASLDELPQLVNVVRGDMSIVGPRPLLMDYLAHYSKEQSRRHEVRPGITGWAQVNGRNAISWDRKLQLDVWYVEHVSPILDLRILAATVQTVLFGGDHRSPGHPTAPSFIDPVPESRTDPDGGSMAPPDRSGANP